MHSTPLVLAVDDDPDTLALLRVFLTCERFSVATASNAAQAMEVVLRGGVDAVVTDLAMPETDGGQLIQRIRAAGIGIPVVVTRSPSGCYSDGLLATAPRALAFHRVAWNTQ